MRKNFLKSTLLILSITNIFCQEVTIKNLDNNNIELNINLLLSQDNYLYKDTLTFSVDTPDATVAEWNASTNPKSMLDEKHFNENKLVYSEPTSFKVDIKSNKLDDHVSGNLFMRYLLSSSKQWQEKIISFNVGQESPQATGLSNKIENKNDKELTNRKSSSGIITFFSKKLRHVFYLFNKFVEKIKKSAISLLSDQTAASLRIFMAFILGVLLSLTPCIYPMIPVTVGILQQAAGYRSFWKNFIFATCYTLGIGCTFAVLGLVASFGGPAFGQLLGSPIFVIILVLLFGYLGLSMLGFYEMYIPQFLQSSQSKVHHGSYLSAFIFGAVSGTIASPCLSPGLALILSIVATMGNKLLGFLMLFAFGVGSSTPLLLIATFSSCITLLPQAGMWMVEVKRLFGFMLLGICIYYLQAILAWKIIMLLISLFVLLTGLFYILDIKKYDSNFAKKTKAIIGSIFIIAALYLFVQTYKAVASSHLEKNNIWQNDYIQAKGLAIQNKQKLFLDFGAAWCSLCKVIDSKIFTNSKVIQALQDFVAVKIDGTSASNEQFATLKQKFNITGLPTILIIDPETESILKIWNGELYDYDIDKFIQELKNYTLPVQTAAA